MLTYGPTLETSRLILRPPLREDLNGFYELMSDPQAAKYIGGVLSRTSCWRGMCTIAGSWVLQGFSMFSVIEKNTGAWVGRVGPWQPEGWPGTEVGWGLVRRVWGKGYATEAVTASIDWAFDNLGWTEIIHCIEEHNEPSKAVAHRLGSKPLRATKLPEPYTEGNFMLWGQTRDEWRARTENWVQMPP